MDKTISCLTEVYRNSLNFSWLDSFFDLIRILENFTEPLRTLQNFYLQLYRDLQKLTELEVLICFLFFWSLQGFTEVMTPRLAYVWTQLTLGVIFTLTLSLLCWPLGEVRGQTELSLVLEDLLRRYGDNGTISIPQLRSLLVHLNTEPEGRDTLQNKSNNNMVSEK